MPYTAQQISDQEKVVQDLDEKIKWINDESHHFTGGQRGELYGQVERQRI